MSPAIIRKAPALRAGDAVGVFSPSWPVVEELRAQFETGIACLRSLGLTVKLGKNVFSRHYYSAGTRAERLADFHALWRDPQVRMLLMSQGGQTINHLLDGIDYELIARNPKLVAGISDGTSLLNAIFARTGLVTYHGPDLLFTFGRRISEPFLKNLRDVFFDGRPGRLIPNPAWQHQEKPGLTHCGWHGVRPGKARGILMGGHCERVLELIATGFAPDFSGALLFLEGTQNVDRLDRCFTNLRLAGVFDRIAGLILGWFEGAEPADRRINRPVREIIAEVTAAYDFPILEIGELGHNVENYVLPIGCTAEIDAQTLSLEILDETVSGT